MDTNETSEEYIPVLQTQPPPPVVKTPSAEQLKKDTNGTRTHSQAYGEKVPVVRSEQNQELHQEPRTPVALVQTRPPPITNNSREGRQAMQEQTQPEVCDQDRSGRFGRYFYLECLKLKIF